MDSLGGAATDAWNKPLFVVCSGSFGSRGRVDANDSTEGERRCGAALGLKESGIKADHSRLISLSNLCRGVCVCVVVVGVRRDFFWQSAVSRQLSQQQRCSSLSSYWCIRMHRMSII